MTVILSSLIALLIVMLPIAALAGMLLVTLAVARAQPWQTRRQCFLIVVAVLLVGYALLGRGFAYLGLSPVYLGEIGLAIGVVLIGVIPSARFSLQSRSGTLLLAFMLLGAVRLSADLRQYGLTALRDSVIWAYAAYAVLIAIALIHSRTDTPSRFYGRLLPILLLWTPAGVILTRFAPGWLPVVPGSDVTLVHLYGGQVAAHLAGIAAFLLLGLHLPSGNPKSFQTHILELGAWCLWVISFLLVATGRAAIVATLLPLSLLLILHSTRGWKKFVLVAASLSMLTIVASPRLQFLATYDGTREVSPHQIVDNVKSIFGRFDRAGLEGTRTWRLAWWTDIVNYTVKGKYFWHGKGFGKNLADDDGYQVLADQSLRSPHNGHLTVLARMGVPSFLLWLALHITFATALLRRTPHPAAASPLSRRLEVWILVYLLAFFLEASFGVTLEGPHGGIWYWSVFGTGLALIARKTTRNQKLLAG